MRCRRSPAFTIVELLFVTTIIMLLASILLPVFVQARQAAKKTACLSNIRQASLATILYCGDYDDTFPCGNLLHFETNDTYEALFWWGGFQTNYSNLDDIVTTYHPEWGFIYPYMNNTTVQSCLSQNIASGYHWPIGYGYNPLILLDGMAIKDNQYVYDDQRVMGSQVEIPAETLLYGDAASVYCENGTGPCSLYTPNTINPPVKQNGQFSTPSVQGRHGGMANMGLADGHARSFPVSIRPFEDLPLREQDTGEVQADFMAGSHVGDIVNPRFPYGSRNVNYYFSLTKS